MRLFALPDLVRGIVFDIDGTLYTNDAYAGGQIRVLIERLAERRGVDADAMEAEVEAYRRRWSAEHEGKKISLGNAFVAFGVSIQESVRWREELIEPEAFLKADPRLRETLRAFGPGIAFSAVTNNPASVGKRTLAALGVEDFFSVVVGLDTFGVSKPHRAPFERVAEVMGREPRSCLAVGDRYDLDVAPALELGMGGVLVDGVEDVYTLPAALEGRLPRP